MPVPIVTEDDATLAGDDSAQLGALRRALEGWLTPGACVGRYIILSRLGSGGMGVVYAAYDPELDRKVALKLLRPGMGTMDSRRAREHLMLKQEAQALAKLSHPNVIAVHDVGEHEGSVFLAMEFVDGRTLGGWLEDEHDWREVVAMLLRAGEGLRAAHEQGLVHRDFKPDNVMVGTDGRVRVMDFGLARSAALLDGAEATGVVGTPAYMAPEQYLGVGIDARSDQFSFCVALWEGLFGERPFEGDTVTELVTNIELGRLRSLTRRGTVPSWLRKVVLRGLEADPEKRYPTMDALLQALRRDPSRVRRRWAGAAAVVVLAGGAWAGHAWAEARERARCQAWGRTIEAEWSASARAAVEQAMRQHEVTFAQETWERVAPGLDEYAAGWQRARVEACTAERVEGRWAPAVAASANDCLEERRAAFGSLVGLLEQVDLEQLALAGVAVRSLPPLEACVDEDALARRPPPGAADRERSLGVRTEAMRGEVEWKAGRREAGQARLEGALAEARALDDAELEALVEGKLGDLRVAQGRYDEGAEHLRRAYFTHGRLGQHPSQLSLAIAIARVEAEHLERAAVAESWLDHARMHHQHDVGHDVGPGPGASEPLLVTRLQASLLADRGDYEAALAAARRAWQEGLATLGADHPTVEGLSSTIVDIETRRGNYDVALALTLEALERLRRLLGPHHPEVGRTLVNLAMIEAHLGQRDQAYAHAREAVVLTRQSVGPEHPHTLVAERELIGLQLERGEREEALAGIERVLASYQRRESADGLEVRALLGGQLIQLGEHTRAVQVLQDALDDMRLRHGADHPESLGLLVNLGVAHRGLGDDERAARAYREALRVGEATMAPDHPMLAFSLTNLGNVEREQGNLEEARRLLERALEIRRAKLSPTHVLVASTLESLARVDLDERRPEAAIERLESALAIATKAADAKRRAGLELLLGRALLDAEGDRARAIALVTGAEHAFATLGQEPERAEAERVLRSLDAEPTAR